MEASGSAVEGGFQDNFRAVFAFSDALVMILSRRYAL
jgi:hypothetical protein